MQFFDGRNYRINKVLLSCVGQWPYQTNRSSNAIIIIIVSLAGTQFIAKICGLLSIDDIDVFIDSLSPLVVDLGCGVKLITCILKATEIRALFDQIQYDWQLLITSPHIKILNNYAQSGRTFTIIYAIPLQPLLLGSSSNETTRPLLHQVEYYIDMEKYYFPILIHGYVTAVICVSIAIAVDTMYVIVVQHVCGLFMIIGQQLENIVKGGNLEINFNPSIKNDKPYKNIISSIHAHKRALRFASLIEAVFSQMFLVVAGFNMLIISMTGVMAVTNLDKPEEFLRQITFSCALLTHLFFESFLAQRLIDHSTHILISLTNIAWYQTSSRTRKILIFMIMKTREPCVLTAGKMFVISMDTFSTIVRTSVSYFTMLRSMQ
ncbi:PREDICTED: odorant receptor 13a-like isoform X2 [Wasmannia auropunctata]|uniref:odorant receptor 13a-like isoform X2 n=1 Tax=Wasmannia auropunctata TaxID=64793 RepID=UPI0005EE537F|nr:PREDICTED: odorant receptor 13a-like isoform X2 [Wasmannia auropunctata]